LPQEAITVLSSLVLWSWVALIVRVVAIGVLLYIVQIQIKQFQFKSHLQPLKRLLLSALIVLILSNVPILFLHVERIENVTTSAAATSFATVSNALGMLVVAVLLLLVYRFKGVD
jgi:hypothetical protein